MPPTTQLYRTHGDLIIMGTLVVTSLTNRAVLYEQHEDSHGNLVTMARSAARFENVD
jgi:hypothetical protein